MKKLVHAALFIMFTVASAATWAESMTVRLSVTGMT
jgi:hypothetical protein